MSDQRTPLIQILKAPPSTPGPYGPGRPRQRRAGEEVCELCSAGLDDAHGHLVNMPTRSLMCVCRPCYLLFAHGGAGGARFRAVPTRYLALSDAATMAREWDALQVPIGLAFFFRNSATGRVTAFYPSPAGATESELPLEAWDALAAAVPPLATLATDVEALLVRRVVPQPGGMSVLSVTRPDDSALAGVVDERLEALIVPIDACYELVGRIRQAWSGMQGGDEVGTAIDEFFARAMRLARESEDTLDDAAAVGSGRDRAETGHDCDEPGSVRP